MDPAKGIRMGIETGLLLSFNVVTILMAYLFLNIQMQRRTDHFKPILVIGLLYYAVLLITVFHIRHPISTLCANLLMMGLFSTQFHGTIFKKIATVVFSYFCLFLSEAFASVLVFSSPLKNHPLKTLFILITATFLSSFTLLLIHRYLPKRILVTHHLPVKYWFFLSVPVLSMLYIYVQLRNQSLHGLLGSFMLATTFLLNLTLFAYMIDSINRGLLEHNQSTLSKQVKYYSDYIDRIQQTQDEIYALQHDLRYSLVTLKVYNKNKDYQKVDQCLNDLLSHVSSDQQYAKSGNKELDSLINYMLADLQDVDISVSVHAPHTLCINPLHLNVVLGNILDNAKTALHICVESEMEAPFLHIEVMYHTNCLSIHVVNSIRAHHKKHTKQASEKHGGYGTRSIRRIVAQYGGSYQFFTHPDRYEVKVMMLDKAT